MDDSSAPSSEFTRAEIEEMQNIYMEIKGQSLSRDFCEDLAMRFSCSSDRAENFVVVTCQQVRNWFRDIHKSVVDPSWSCVLRNEPESSLKPKEEDNWEYSETMGDGINSLNELAFEAQSAKDYAWYDVATFLSCKTNNQGELEVRVRFSGFNRLEDEWVNMKTGVRERSIPLEPSECQKVNVGDLVLCFVVREHYELYGDACVVGIERKLHDLKACSCIFTVHYDYDDTEEKVNLERICRRPAEAKFPDGESREARKEIFADEDLKMSFLY